MDPISELTLDQAREELRARRGSAFGGQADDAREAALEDRISELLDTQEPGAEAVDEDPHTEDAQGFTEEERGKIDAWARTPGVPTSALPLEYRAAVEHRRDELAAETPAGTAPVFAELEAQADEEPVVSVRELTARELIAVLHNDTETYPNAGAVEVPAALEELRKRATTDTVDGALEEGEPWSGRDVRLAASFVESLEEPVELDEAPLGRDVAGRPVTGHAGGQDLTEDEADVLRRYAGAIELARAALATYQRRQARLDALEVRDTQAARQAKLELDLGEAREALAEVTAILEEA